MFLFQSSPLPMMLPFKVRFFLPARKIFYIMYLYISCSICFVFTSETPVTIQMLTSLSLLHIYVLFSGYFNVFFFFFLINFFFYLFLAALGLRCCSWASSSCGKWGLLFVAVRRLLIVVASLVVEHGLYACGLP